MQEPPELAHAAGIVVGGTGVVAGWSPAAERLLGYAAAEVIGRPVTALLSDPLPLAREWAGAVEARHADGTRRRLMVRVWPTGMDGEVVVVAYDLSAVPWWEANRSLLEHLLAHAPVAIAVLDTDLRYVWGNAETERLGGVPLEDRLGRTLGEIQPHLDHVAGEAAMRQVLETGEPIMDYEFKGRVVRAPDEDYAGNGTIFRVEDADGRPTGICYMVIDASERRRTRDRLALLDEVGKQVGTTLDVSVTARELATFLVPRLADLVVVDLFDSVLTGGEPAPGRTGRMATLRRAAHHSIRPGTPEAVVRVGEEVTYAPGSLVDRWLDDGEPHREAVDDLSALAWMAADTARAAKIREFGLRSHMAVPVRARDASLGIVTFVRWQRTDPFVEQDLALAQAVVDRAALSLDNARRYTREHVMALALQRSLLPRGAPDTPLLDVATRYLSADPRTGVSGDWYDAIPLSGARHALVVGDVVGHGVTAAVTMGRLRTAVRALADMDLPPDELLAHLDDLVLRFIDEETSGDPLKATALLGSTCLVAVVDPVARTCAVARAGHPPPLIVTPGGTVELPGVPAGPPLGLGTLPFEAVEIAFPAGSRIVLYTDGLTRGDSGPERLRVLAEQAEDDPESLCAALVADLGSSPPDDATLMVVRNNGIDRDRIAGWDFGSDPAEVAGIRGAVGRQLATWELSALEYTTELIVSELVTNAIRYGLPPFHLRLVHHTVLTCEVRDARSTAPRLRHARTTDEGGRGLFLVARMSKRWGTRHLPTGKIIWCEQELRPAAGDGPSMAFPGLDDLGLDELGLDELGLDELGLDELGLDEL